jgi:hypothetical protein
MKTTIWLIVILFISCSSSSKQSNSELIELFEVPNIPIIIPFEFINNKIVLTGEIEGSILKFTLDNLGDYSNLYEEVAYKILDTNKTSIWKIYQEGFESLLCKKQVTIQIFDFSYMIDTLEIVYSKGRFNDGLIGTSFFYDKIVKIDFDSSQILLYQKLPEEYSEYIALELFGTKHKVNDRRVRLEFETLNQEKITEEFLFDLGGLHSYFDTSVRAKIDMNQMSKDSNNFSSVLLFRSFLINRNINAEFINGQTGELINLQERNQCNGVIGMDIIKQYNLIFDYNGKHLYLKPNANYRSFTKPTL